MISTITYFRIFSKTILSRYKKWESDKASYFVAVGFLVLALIYLVISLLVKTN